MTQQYKINCSIKISFSLFRFALRYIYKYIFYFVFRYVMLIVIYCLILCFEKYFTFSVSCFRFNFIYQLIRIIKNYNAITIML